MCLRVCVCVRARACMHACVFVCVYVIRTRHSIDEPSGWSGFATISKMSCVS